MPAVTPIQTSFAAGELSPRVRGRVDAEVYKAGLSFCENWELLPAGAMRKRGGTQYIGPLLSGGSRLIPFKSSSGQDFILELGHLEMRIHTLAGRLSIETGGGGAVNLVENGTFDSGTGWTLLYAVISGGRLRLNVVSVFDPELRIYETEEGLAHRLFTVSAPGQYQVSWTKGTGAAGLRVRLTNAVNATVALLTAPGAVDLPAGDFRIWCESFGVAGEHVYVDDVSVVAVGAPESYSIVTPWTEVQAREVQHAMESGRDRMVLVHPNVAPWAITRNANGTWTHGTIEFTAAPASWADANWPGVVEIHNGRLWLAGAPDERNRVLASRVGSLFDFRKYTNVTTGAPAVSLTGTEETQVTPEGGIDFRVSTKGAIRWMAAQRTLLIGTDQGEHYLSSSTGVVTPTDIQVVLGSHFGAARVQAVPAGDEVLYVSPDRRKPRVIGWELQAEGWVSRDLAFLAEHLTLDLLGEAHFVKAPYPAAVFPTGGGRVLVCGYDRAQRQAAWWRFRLPGGAMPDGSEAPDGFVNSIAVTDGAYGSIVWLSVTRDTGVHLEVFRLDDEATHLMDARVATTVGAGGVVGGLAHLEGHLVQVVVADAVLEAEVQDGQLVLEDVAEGEPVWVGIAFTPRAVTLPFEGGSARGSSQGASKRHARVGVILNGSAIPKVNGRRAPERAPATPTDARAAAVTGLVEIANLGWSQEAAVTFEQDVPYRTEICALCALTKVNEL